MEATIVSAMPIAINENKIGVYPSYYGLEKADKDKIKILIVKDGTYRLYGGEMQEWIQVPLPAMEIAAAICVDYRSSMPEISPSAGPALFAINEPCTIKEVREKHEEALSIALTSQVAWFKRLVSLADDEWQKFRQHRMISDLQRIAVDYLGIEREWKDAATPLELPRCPACGSSTLPDVAVCLNCRCILDREKFDNLSFAGDVEKTIASPS